MKSIIPLATALLCNAALAASPQIPKTWDDAEMRKLELPLADPAVSRAHAPADYYYRIPVRPIFKSYPVYHPEKEPAGYFEGLHKLKPELLWDDKGTRPRLDSEAEWIAAGELVFDAPIIFRQRRAAWPFYGNERFCSGPQMVRRNGRSDHTRWSSAVLSLYRP
jgi:hypothetical protein